MKNRLSNPILQEFGKIFFLFLLLCYFALSGQAQKHFARIYTEADGLSSSMVFDVVQDSAGVLWFASRSGVSSYNGITFTNYSFREGLSQGSFTFLKIDEKGNLWAMPQKGTPCVFRFDGHKWNSFACLDTPKVNATFSAFDVTYSGNDPIVTIGTVRYGLFVIKGNEWMQFTVKDGLPGNFVRGIYATGNKIYVATDKGLSLIRDFRVNQDHRMIRGFPFRHIHAIAPGRQTGQDSAGSKIWVLGEGWMGYLQEGRFSLCVSDFKITVGDIQSYAFLYPDLRGGVYFGNPFYVYYYHPAGGLESIGRGTGLVSEGATKVMTDREKNTWFSSYRGITKVPLTRIEGYTQTEGLYDNEVASALETGPGRYLFGHHGALTMLENGKFTHIQLPASANMKIQEKRIQDMDIDRQGTVWIAASSLGLGRMDHQGGIRWYRAEKGLTGMIISVCVDPSGTVFASNDRKLFRYDTSRDVFQELPREQFPTSGIRKIFSGKDNNLFLASYSDGLVERRNNREINYQSPDRKQGTNVYAFLQDSRNRKWVGASDGLFLVADTVLLPYYSNGLSISRPVYVILEDKQGNIWFGTDNGVFCWDGEFMEHFSTIDGFFGLEVNRDAGFVDRYGMIWFGTNNGINIISPATQNPEDKIPPPLVRLTYFESGKDTLWPDRNHVIPASGNTLIFHFQAISLIDEQRVFYKCILEGFENAWSSEIFAHTAQYRYSNLRPGTYRFCIKACNALGIWSEPVCSGIIRIKQPFWFQWWFVLACLLLVVSALYGTGRILIIRRYNLSLKKMVAIRTRELRKSEKDLQESNAAKDNFFSIIAHDLKSPFNAILGMLELLTTEYSEFSDQERQKILLNLRNASVRTIDLLENLLTWAQAQKGLLPFSPLKFDLMELIAEIIALFDPTAQAKKISLVSPTHGPAIVYADRNMVSTVIRNLISNAIKFSFPGSAVTIHVDHSSPKKVLFSVTDTGMGMNEQTLKSLFLLDKRTTVKGTGNETGTGLGLILSKDFVTRNKGTLSIESKEGKGSTFCLSLPVNPPD